MIPTSSCSMVSYLDLWQHSHTCAKSHQSCPTFCDPMDCGLPGSSVQGILQARILQWVAIPSSRGSFQPRDRICISLWFLHWQEGSLPRVPPGNPYSVHIDAQFLGLLASGDFSLLITSFPNRKLKQLPVVQQLASSHTRIHWLGNNENGELLTGHIGLLIFV